MFTIDKLYQPRNIAEAAELLTKYPDITVLGGCGFLKLGNRKIATALDLSRCSLAEISETEQYIELGAMVTLRDVEVNPALNHTSDAVLPKAVAHILGVQFRRCATIGASVYSKYGFSDILPALLAMNTEVELLRSGRMPLGDFLAKPISRDVLISVRIIKDSRRAAYQNLRNAGADFPILNAAVSRHEKQWTVIVGARPARAEIAVQASQLLSDMAADSIDIDKVAATAAAELTFGSNNKASADYRRAMCQVLVKRAIGEVLA